jgi:hypothetical protein
MSTVSADVTPLVDTIDLTLLEDGCPTNSFPRLLDGHHPRASSPTPQQPRSSFRELSSSKRKRIDRPFQSFTFLSRKRLHPVSPTPPPRYHNGVVKPIRVYGCARTAGITLSNVLETPLLEKGSPELYDL